MNARSWAGVLFVIGSMGIIVGVADPLEGSVVILGGSALALAAVLLGRSPRRVVIYWVWTFMLIAAGVCAMFAWSSVGGIGGKSGHSMWWLVTMLPYPIGWVMAVWAIFGRIIQAWKARRQTA